MIALVGPSLNQWDTRREVELTGPDAAAETVQFSQYLGASKALVVEARRVRPGVKRASIPNAYLTQRHSICAFTWDGDNAISGSRFPVHARVRPANYVYTPTEVRDYEDLRQWVLDMFQGLVVEGTRDYERLENKPRINHVVLVGDRDLPEIGVATITESDIDGLFAV